MKKHLPAILPLIALLLATSCMKDDELWNSRQPLVHIPYEGVFIINEGNFMYGNASLSYYDKESREIMNDVFYNINSLPLGDVAQSMQIRDSLGYVVLNNSGKIYIININTFEYVGKITGLTSPRHIHFINDEKAYVTDLYAKAISIVNPKNMTVTGNIDVSNPDSQYYQHPTEMMVQHGKYAFTNCWSFDNKILVIDTERDALVDSIEVRKQPNSLVIDKNDKIWVLTDGGFEGNPYAYEPPALICIDANSREVEDSILFDISQSPSELTINESGDTLYFLMQGIQRFVPANGQTPELLIAGPYSAMYSGGFYGLGIDPENSDIYVADAKDNVQAGWVYRYAPDGTSTDSMKVGIVPGAFCFKKER